MSVNRQFLFGLLAGVVVVGLLLFSVWMATGRPVVQSQQNVSVPPRSARIARPHDHQPLTERNKRSEETPTPPWMDKNAAGSMPELPQSALAKPDLKLHRPALPMTADGQVDIPAVEARIDALIKRHGGNSVIRGVDFAVLKENMEKAQEMQSVAKEMQALNKQKNPDLKKLKALTERIQTLQQDIQKNMAASGLMSSSRLSSK